MPRYDGIIRLVYNNIIYCIETIRVLSARNYVPDCLSAAGFVLLLLLYIILL